MLCMRNKHVCQYISQNLRTTAHTIINCGYRQYKDKASEPRIMKLLHIRQLWRSIHLVIFTCLPVPENSNVIRKQKTYKY